MWGSCRTPSTLSWELVSLHTSRADLSNAFSSYCGYPPMGRWRDCAHRVCMRCQMGVVLRAPEGAEPRHDDPFLIVDRELAVQAVSRNAELGAFRRRAGQPRCPTGAVSDLLQRRPRTRRASATGRGRVRRCPAVEHARTTQRRKQRAPSSSTGHQLRRPAGRAAGPNPPRDALNGVSKPPAAHQPAARNGGSPGQRDMTRGDNLVRCSPRTLYARVTTDPPP
jgi:hypothetical protein